MENWQESIVKLFIVLEAWDVFSHIFILIVNDILRKTALEWLNLVLNPSKSWVYNLNLYYNDSVPKCRSLFSGWLQLNYGTHIMVSLKKNESWVLNKSTVFHATNFIWLCLYWVHPVYFLDKFKLQKLIFCDLKNAIQYLKKQICWWKLY
jgi:hypothetical protein